MFELSRLTFSCKIIILGFIHFDVSSCSPLDFHCCLICWLNVPEFIYAFSCWWAFALFPVFCYYEQCCKEYFWSTSPGVHGYIVLLGTYWGIAKSRSFWPDCTAMSIQNLPYQTESPWAVTKVDQPFQCQGLPGPTAPKGLPCSLPVPLSPRFNRHAGPHHLCLVEGVSLSSW